MALPPVCLVCEELYGKAEIDHNVKFIEFHKTEEQLKREKEYRERQRKIKLENPFAPFCIPGGIRIYGFCDKHQGIEKFAHLTLGEAMKIYMKRLEKRRKYRKILTILLLGVLSIVAVGSVIYMIMN